MSGSWQETTQRFGRWVGMSIVAMLAAACGDSESSAPAPVPPAVASVLVAPGTSSILEGGQVSLVASPRDAGNRPLERTVTWASGNTAVATVAANGTVTGLAAGQATITATSEGKSGSAIVDVVRVPVAEVRLSVDEEVQLAWNGTAQLAATAHDALGNVLTGRTVTWRTSNAAVVTVAPDGKLQAVASGTALVSASIEGKNSVVGVRVGPVPVTAIAIDGTLEGLEVGETAFITATLTGANGAPVQRPVLWTSSAPAVATVDANAPTLAAVQGVGSGRVTITASVDGKSASRSFTITPRPTHDLVYTRWSGNGSVSELFVLGLGGTSTPPVRLNAGAVSREPSPSPDGQRLVFSISQTHPVTGEPQHDLYIVNRNGMGMRQLTAMTGYEHQPRWSPDGTRIVFRGASDNVARPDLWVINPDGSGVRNLTAALTPQQFTDLRDPSWSPDGTRIAFIGASKGQHKVWVMNADGSNLRQVTTDAGFDNTPSWSPDGDVLAFTRWNVEDPTLGEDVMIVPLATGVPHRLALPGDQRGPTWSPDGHYLALMGTTVAGRGEYDLYTLRPDGTGLRLRTVNAAWGGGTTPAWIRR